MAIPTDPHELMALRDPAYVGKIMPMIRLAMKGWFRSEVHDMDRIPEGGALVVSNHSGGLLTMDLPIIATAFFETFGGDRELFCLAHDLLFTGPTGMILRKCGFLPADRENARAALEAGAVTVVFPGGDYDTFRPTLSAGTTIDFDGRTGYVRMAQACNVPIVPVVSIGGQEGQLHITRGEFLAKLLRFDKMLRTKYFPISFGFPFGFSAGVFPPNIPLPTKITTQVLDPIDIVAEFGPDADAAQVDVEIRARMQAALDKLASERRLPIIG